MATPAEVLAQLLSAEQAAVLDAAGGRAWSAMATALGTLVGEEPALTDVDARLVMPDEIVDEFGASHVFAPIELSTEQDQSATAYVAALTDDAAAFFESQADAPEEQEQQTVVIASAILGQVVAAMAGDLVSRSTNGLALGAGDIEPNRMGEILGTVEDPGLYLTATIAAARSLPVRLFFPGTFLDIVAGSLPPETEDAAAEADDAPPASADEPDLDLPFSLTEEELANATVLGDDDEAPASAGDGDASGETDDPGLDGVPPQPEPQPVAAGAFGREPTPIGQAAVRRATFAPIPEAAPPAPSLNLDLLSGLDMTVSVELGRTALTVAEVLDIGPGSVIELERLAGEPVDILVNDRVIARGEVVVVDENFGVRVVSVNRPGAQDDEPPS